MLSFDFLVGKWRNDFVHNGVHDFEICEIDSSGCYFVDNEHWFNVIDFRYIEDLGKHSFIKSAVKDGDSRQFLNVFSKITHSFLENEAPDSDQSTYSISYTRI